MMTAAWILILCRRDSFQKKRTIETQSFVYEQKMVNFDERAWSIRTAIKIQSLLFYWLLLEKLPGYSNNRSRFFFKRADKMGIVF